MSKYIYIYRLCSWKQIFFLIKISSKFAYSIQNVRIYCLIFKNKFLVPSKTMWYGEDICINSV